MKVKSNHKILIRLLLLCAVLFILSQLPSKATYAVSKEVYQDGIYCYEITNEQNLEVKLIGVDLKENIQDLVIPGTALLNSKEYHVVKVDIDYTYYMKEAYLDFYQKVNKLTIAENFTGSMDNMIYAFPQVRTVEFKGTNPPKQAYFELTNSATNPDILFLVPEGSKQAYAGVIQEVMQYSTLSDIYEHQITLNPTIASDPPAKVEKGCFTYDNYIFQVISPAGKGTGKVKLIGLLKFRQASFLALPEKVNNDSFHYQVTELGTFSLVYSGAKIIDIPDTVVKMDSGVFDKSVEVLFLSKNCKIIPRGMIADENNESNLKFVSVPEGVTTISENAFNLVRNKQASIILPSTIKALGKKSLYLFQYVTFLNKKPLNNIKASIANGTTVKVDSSVIKKYKASLSSKVSVIAAKKVVKTTKLSVADSSLKLKVKNKLKEKASLSKTSNETIFWISSDPKVVEVTSKGTITAKSKGSAYVIAYTRTSGRYKTIKVTVTK